MTGESSNNSKEFYAYTIAILVIGSFVFFFGYSLITKPTIDTAKDVTSLYGGYVAAVLVYFFGQKQSQILTTQAVKAEKERDKLRQVHNTEYGTLDSSKERYAKDIELLESLKKQYGAE